MLRGSLLIITLAATLSALADDEPVPDFSDGFKRLAALGLPDMQGAQWTSSAPPEILQSSPLNEWTFRDVGIQPAGRVWLMAGEKPSYLHFGQISPSTTEANAPKPGKSPLKTDIKHLIRTLNKIRSTGANEFSSHYFANIRGNLLIFAAQIYQAGHPDQANQVAHALFQTSTDRAAIIDQAVSQFANAAHTNITNQFFEDHDWEAYHRNLKTLINDYPRGWDKRLAVAVLLPKVAERAANSSAPTPKLPEIPLDQAALDSVSKWMQPAPTPSEPNEDELQRLAQEHGFNLADVPAEHRAMFMQQIMASRGSIHGRGSTQNWLLNPPDPESATNPIEHTKSLGMDAIPVLAALVEDDTLTSLPNTPSDSRSSYYHSRMSDAELARHHYQSMARPQTRGEIATTLLTPLLANIDEYNELSPLEIRDRAIEFWQQHHKKSPPQLALLYLTEGNDSQKQSAARFLAASDDPKAWEMFEKTILEAPDILAVADFVRPYLESRKHQARPFFESFATKIRKAMEGVDIENVDYQDSAYRIASYGGADKFLSPLAVIAGASSVSDLLDKAVQAGANDPIAWDNLANSLNSTPLTELLKPVGQKLAKTNSATRSRLLDAFLARAARWTIDDRNNPPPSDALPNDIATLWQPAIEDQSSLTSDESGWFEHYEIYSVRAAASIVLEFACNQNASEEIDRAKTILNASDKFTSLLIDRASARLSGSPVPAYPSHTALSDQRKQELVSLITQSKPAELREKILALKPDEIDYWIEWRRGPWAKLEDMPDVLQKLRQTVTLLTPAQDETKKIQSGSFFNRLADAVRDRAEGDPNPGPDPTILKNLNVTPGFHLDGPAIESLAKSLLKQADSRSKTIINFFPESLSLGLEASAQQGGEELTQWITYYAREEKIATAGNESDAIAIATVAGWQNMIIWQIKDGTISAVTELAGDDFPAIRVYQTYLESPNPEIPHTTIIVLTRDDFQKFQNEN